ncbi:MAG: hypothetical protein ACLFP1_02970 [Candidatus Goldiibacteriota bacterium]
MLKRKTAAAAVFFAAVLCVVLAALAPDEKYGHTFIYVLIVPAVALSILMQLKDALIASLFLCAGIWIPGLFGVFENVLFLIPETAVIISTVFMVGANQSRFKKEIMKRENIVEYKKERKEKILAELKELETENRLVLEEIKGLRKEFYG